MSRTNGMNSSGVTPGLNATTRGEYGAISENDDAIAQSFLNFRAFRQEPSVRSERRHKLNVIYSILLALAVSLLIATGALVWYRRVLEPKWEEKAVEEAIRKHAAAAALRAEQCRGIDWKTACDSLGSAGARRNLYTSNHFIGDMSSEMEDKILDSDDPTVTYDSNCLRVYRLDLYGNITFPYHSSQLLRAGGNQSMALFIQHGAMRNAQDYFCSFK